MVACQVCARWGCPNWPLALSPRFSFEGVIFLKLCLITAKFHFLGKSVAELFIEVCIKHLCSRHYAGCFGGYKKK